MIVLLLLAQSVPQASNSLEPGTMILIILCSLLLVAATDRILKLRGRHARTSYLARALVSVPEIMKIHSSDREGAIREMIRFAARMIRAIDEPTLTREVLKRESEMATGLVHGIAVPHARFHRIDRSYVLFGRSERGIPWDCVDSKPAQLIFLILSPEDDPQGQLHLLAEIGRCANDPECLELLRSAEDCRIITRAIEKKAADHRHRLRRL